MPWIPRHQYDNLLDTLDSVADTVIRMGGHLTDRKREIDRLTLELAAAQADQTRAYAEGFDAGVARGRLAAAAQEKIDAVIETSEQARKDTCQYSYFGCTGLGYWQEDPYAAEIHGDHRVVLACDSCTRARAEDI